MPPEPGWYDGADAVAEFVRARPLAPGTHGRALPIRANGQLAFAHYGREDGRFVAHAISVLTLRGEQIAEITVLRTPAVFARFGLPSELAGLRNFSGD